MNSSVTKKLTPYKLMSYIILALLTVFLVFPLYWIFTGSLKNATDINSPTPQWFPTNPTMENYTKLFENPAWLCLWNTMYANHCLHW